MLRSFGLPTFSTFMQKPKRNCWTERDVSTPVPVMIYSLSTYLQVPSLSSLSTASLLPSSAFCTPVSFQKKKLKYFTCALNALSISCLVFAQTACGSLKKKTGRKKESIYENILTLFNNTLFVNWLFRKFMKVSF